MAQTGVVSWSTSTGTSNGTADSNVNFAEGMAPAAVNDSARNQMASVAMFRDDTSGKLVASGTSTAYALTTNQVFSTLGYLSGQRLAFSVNTTNGAAATLNVDTLGAKALNLTSTTAVPAGFFKATGRYDVSYNSSGGFFLVHGQSDAIVASTISTSGTANIGGALTAASVTTGAITASSLSVSGGSILTGAVTAGGTLTVASNFSVSSGTVTLPAGSVANAALAAPGGLVRITSTTSNGTSTISIATGLTSTYKNYKFVLQNLLPGTDNTTIYMQYSTTGGSSWMTTGYITQIMAVNNNTVGAATQDPTLIFLVAHNMSNVTAFGGLSGTVTLIDPAGTTYNKTALVQTSYTAQNTGLIANAQGCGMNTASGQAAVNAVRFVAASGNIVAGKVTLYGLTDS